MSYYQAMQASKVCSETILMRSAKLVSPYSLSGVGTDMQDDSAQHQPVKQDERLVRAEDFDNQVDASRYLESNIEDLAPKMSSKKDMYIVLKEHRKHYY